MKSFLIKHRIKVLIIGFIVSLLGNMPPYHTHFRDLVTPLDADELLANEEDDPSIAQVRHIQVARPFTNLPEWGYSTQGKQDFRILVPVLAYITHTPLIVWVVLQHFLAGLFLYLWYTYWRKTLNNEFYALLLSLTLMFTAVFKTFHLDLHPRFDAYAYLLLFFAWMHRDKPYMALWMFLSFWVDERSLPASLMIVVLMYVEKNNALKKVFPFVTVALLTYAGGRYSLYHFYDMQISTNFVAEKGVFFINWPYVLYGIQSSAKALSAACVLYMIYVISQKDYRAARLYGFCLLLAFAGTFIIIDMTRSNGYYFVLVIFALERLLAKETMPHVSNSVKETVLICVLVACFMIPTFYMYGGRFILYSPFYYSGLHYSAIELFLGKLQFD